MKQITSRFKQAFWALLMIKVLVIGSIWTNTTVAQELPSDTPTNSEDIWDTYPDPFETAAKILDVEVDTLWEQLNAGQSIANVARGKNIDPQTIIEAITQTDIAFLNQLEAAGEIPSEEAAQWRSEMSEMADYTTEFVNESWQFDEEFIDDAAFGPDPFTIATELIGMDEEALFTELESGKSIAEVAQAKGIEPQKIVAAIAQLEIDFMNEIEAAGDIAEAEATQWRDEAQQYAVISVYSAYQDPYHIAANVIGIDEESLWSEMDAGKSIADISQVHGSDPQTVIDAIVAADAKSIDAIVAAGALTAEEAAEWRQDSAQFAAEIVNETLLFDEFDEFDEDAELYYLPDDETYAIAIKLLGMDEAALFAELDSGKSLAAVAQTQGVDPQKIADAIAQAKIAFIDELEAAGDITAADADTWRTGAAQYAAFMVNSTYQDPFTVAAKHIGIDEAALWNELEAGKTIAAVAQTHGVDPQTVIEAIVQSEQADIDQLLSAELISAEEAKEWQAEISDYIQELVTQPLN